MYDTLSIMLILATVVSLSGVVHKNDFKVIFFIHIHTQLMYMHIKLFVLKTMLQNV